MVRVAVTKARFCPDRGSKIFNLNEEEYLVSTSVIPEGSLPISRARRTVADEWRGQASRASTACHEGYTLSFGFQRLTKGKATSTRSACSAAPNLGFAHLFCRMAIQRITSAAHARTA
jgi:hypothetical protein